MPESSTSVRSVAVVHSTTPSTTNGGGVNFMTKKINLSPFMNVKLEPPGSIGSTTAQDQKQRPRLIHLISATSSTGVDSNNRPSPPNILKRSKPATTVTLAGKRPMLHHTTSTYVSSTSTPNNAAPPLPMLDTKQHEIDSSPLSLLAEEAARRSPTLTFSTPSTTSHIRLDPKFIGGPIIEGKEQIDIRKSEIVCQQLSEEKLTGPYVIAIVHSHREYRGTAIKAEHFEGFKEDSEALRRFPLRAWTDSSYHDTKYCFLDIPKLGSHPVAIVQMRDENVINLRFPVLSSDRNNFGHKKFGRLWEQIIFPYDKLKIAFEHWLVTPIQIVAELRDPNKLKKPKRSVNRVSLMPTHFQLGNFGITTQLLPSPLVDHDHLSNGALMDHTSEEDDDETEIRNLVMDIKKEPTDLSDTSMEDLVNNPEKMNDNELINMILMNTKRNCLILPRDHLVLMFRKSVADYETNKKHFERNSSFGRYENGGAAQ